MLKSIVAGTSAGIMLTLLDPQRVGTNGCWDIHEDYMGSTMLKPI